MSARKTDVLLNRLIAITVIFNLSLALILLSFSRNEGMSNREVRENTTQALTTTGTFFLGLAVMINAYYSAKRMEVANRSALAEEKNLEIQIQNSQLAQEKLLADRFMGAVAQLGHDKIETRVGAIYALERVAQDFPKEHWMIMEILTAFVRENTALTQQEQIEQPRDSGFRFGVINFEQDISPKLRTDIQVALSVIGRRNLLSESSNQKLDLRNTDISGADLTGANLQRADLRGASLQRADLTSINLYAANLEGAKLRGSVFYEANLQQTNLSTANLCGANLNKANLSEANLRSANLSGASLRGTNLSNANLYKADLHQASLKVANLSGAKLFLVNLQGAKLGKANLQGAGLIGANLQQANLNGANLQQANLNAAKLQHTEVFFANLYEASLAEADLCGANLMGANLQKAILYEANLCGANLMGANLHGTNLSDVKLEGAILIGAKNLHPQQIRNAAGDRTTRLPDYVEIPTHWRQSS
jgi:uncharacterized protein YjbI with pentapeptide repeats